LIVKNFLFVSQYAPMKIRLREEIRTTALGKALREYRGTRSLREISEEFDVPLATLRGAELGSLVDIRTFVKLMQGLGISPLNWPQHMDFTKK
jgi:hypothetical protein